MEHPQPEQGNGRDGPEQEPHKGDPSKESPESCGHTCISASVGGVGKDEVGKDEGEGGKFLKM